MDMMKKSEMDLIKSNLLEFSASDEISSNYTLIFRDSKTLGYELIQVADMICGTLRTYFESDLTVDKLKKLCFTCEYFSRCSTKQNRALRNEKTLEKKFRDVFLLHTHPEQKIILFHHLVTLPMKSGKYYIYIDCKLTIKKEVEPFLPGVPKHFTPCHVFATFNFFLNICIHNFILVVKLFLYTAANFLLSVTSLILADREE